MLPCREFVAPLPLLAVALMAVNDHLLRPYLPGPWTWQLSDLAAAFFVPLFLTASLNSLLWLGSPLLRHLGNWTTPRLSRSRLLLAAAFTGAVLLSIKLSPAAAETFRGLLDLLVPDPFRAKPVTPDLWDLASLGMLPLSVWYGERRARLLPFPDRPSGDVDIRCHALPAPDGPAP